MASARVAAIVGAALVALGTSTSIWISTPPKSTTKNLALYQAKCHTLYVTAFAELAKNGVYFKALEALRTKEQARIYANKGVGIADSLHTQSLAWDLARVLPDGTVSMKLSDYEEAGRVFTTFGAKLGVSTNWGGDFKHTKDGVHFSCGYGGRK